MVWLTTIGERELLQMTLYYFDSQGRWIAFRTSESDTNVWSPTAEWVGWLAWGNGDVCSVKTQQYLGTFIGDRFLKLTSPPSYYTPYLPYTPYTPYTPYSPYAKSSIHIPHGYMDI